ncbi:Abi family protein [Tunturiibacter gelidiferens]|uniref:Abi family protein n=1 Tax=Tunturiibacter gelidiferens TaxID=3069689 RepID=UPI003D9B50E3
MLHPVTGKEQIIVEDNFRTGTTFEQVTHLYVFDRQLRLLFLDAIERVEVALRVDIAHLLGSRDRFAHRDPLQLHDDFTKKRSPRTGRTHYEDWLQRSEAAFQRSTDEFIKHFKNKYTGRPPVWIEAELWDFGLLSWLLSGLKVADRQVLAHRHRLARPHLLVASIRNINNVRNVCAHHGRLWNRSLGDLSPIPRPREIPLLDHLLAYPNPQHIYSTAAFLQFLLRGIDPATDWGAAEGSPSDLHSYSAHQHRAGRISFRVGRASALELARALMASSGWLQQCTIRQVPPASELVDEAHCFR